MSTFCAPTGVQDVDINIIVGWIWTGGDVCNEVMGRLVVSYEAADDPPVSFNGDALDECAHNFALRIRVASGQDGAQAGRVL